MNAASTHPLDGHRLAARWLRAVRSDEQLTALARDVAAHAFDTFRQPLDAQHLAALHRTGERDVWAAVDELQHRRYVRLFQDGVLFLNFNNSRIARRAAAARRNGIDQ